MLLQINISPNSADGTSSNHRTSEESDGNLEKANTNNNHHSSAEVVVIDVSCIACMHIFKCSAYI